MLTLTGSGDLTINGSLNWTGGTVSGTGTLYANGNVNLSGGSRTLASRTFINAGQLTWTAGSWALQPGALVTNLASGTIDLAGDAGLVASGGGTATLGNAGLLRKSAGSGEASFSRTFINSGTVEIQSGTLRLHGGGSSAGITAVSATATLRFTSGYTLGIGSGVTGAGQVRFESGTIDVGGTYAVTGTNAFMGATVSFLGDYTLDGRPFHLQNGTVNLTDPLNVPTLTVTSGTLNSPSAIAVSGLLTWTGGTISGSGDIHANGSVNLSGITRTLNGRTFINAGELIWTAGSWNLIQGAVVTNLVSGTMDVAGDVGVIVSGGGSGALGNAGWLRKSAGSGEARFNRPFVNSGTVEVQSGTLRFFSTHLQTDGLTLLNGGDLIADENLRLDGGLLAGTGTITGNVTNNGVVAPGASPGQLTIQGTYTQTANGALNIELAGPPDGTNYDRLVITNRAVLAGTLTVSLTNGFYPAPDVLYTNVVRAATRTGTFAAFNYPSNVIGLQVQYGPAQVDVGVVNTRPAIPAVGSRTVDELTLLGFNAGATDADAPAQTLSYSLADSPTNASINAAGQFTWTPTEEQGPLTTNVTIVVTDDGTPPLTTTETFQVTVREINVFPALVLPPDASVNEQTLFTSNATATDSDLPANPLTFEKVSGPVGLTMSPAGAISWAPTEADGSNTFTVMIRVTDTNPPASNATSLSITNSFQITVNEVNLAPTLTPPPDATLAELVLYTATATATDPDLPANALTFALVSGPSNLTVSASGEIAWTPAEAQGPSTNDVRIRVTDSNPMAVNATALSTTNTFRLIVNEVNTAPALTLPPNTSVDELTAYSAGATASDSDWPTNQFVFALVSGPSNLTVSAVGAISWTPAEVQGPGSHPVQIRVTDNGTPPLSRTNNYSLTVREVNLAPTLAAISDRTVNPGMVITFTNSATDPDLPANTLTFTLVSPPAGATISADGVFNWRPAVAQAGATNVIQVRVEDDGTPRFGDTRSFTVVVNALAPVQLTPLNLASGRFRLDVSGTTGPDYILEATTTLTNWTSLETNLSPETPFRFSDPTAGAFTNRFYRVRLSP